jgi:hypothetical protein
MKHTNFNEPARATLIKTFRYCAKLVTNDSKSCVIVPNCFEVGSCAWASREKKLTIFLHNNFGSLLYESPMLMIIK